MVLKEKDRRINADIWVLIIKILALLSWLLFIVAMILSFYAAPEGNYGYLRYHQIPIRESWLTPLTGYLTIVLWLSALLSYFSIFINKFRSRRATDNKLYNVILLLTITIAWVAYIVIQLMISNWALN